MAYNTKPIVTDKDGNPISQYYNPATDSYEAVEGVNGANKVILGNNDLTFQPILDKLDELIGTVVDSSATLNLAKEYTDNKLTQHKLDYMPHRFQDLKNGKIYKFGFQINEEGNPQIIFEEVIE